LRRVGPAALTQLAKTLQQRLGALGLIATDHSIIVQVEAREGTETLGGVSLSVLVFRPVLRATSTGTGNLMLALVGCLALRVKIVGPMGAPASLGRVLTQFVGICILTALAQHVFASCLQFVLADLAVVVGVHARADG